MKTICNVPTGAGQEENQRYMWGDDTYTYISHKLLYIHILHTHMYYIHIHYIPVHTNIAHNHLYINTYCMHIHTYHDFPRPDTEDFETAYSPTPMGPIQAAGSKDSCCCCSVDQLCPTVCDPMDCSTLGFPVPHYLPDFVQTHVH